MGDKVRYIVVSNHNLIGLVEKVNKEIREGWKPLGGVAVDGDDYFYQAMVKEY